MYQIQTLNAIDPLGLNQLSRERYTVGNSVAAPDAILVRSAVMHDLPLPSSLKAVARAGAGVNNIPVEKLTRLGIPVFNTPGANANAVKELVIAGMLMASRNLCQAYLYSRNLTGDDAAINAQVEKEKKQFAGFELPGKTLGVVGLGSIGVKVANAATALGMKVIGYDPSIAIKRAWELSAAVEEITHFDDIMTRADFISVHVPLNAETKHLINAKRLQLAKPQLVLLNFARDGIIDKTALMAALGERRLHAYVCDFPCSQLKDHPQVISLPHLGASTREAEETCAIMAVKQVHDFLEQGVITNSVNFPTVEMPLNKGTRLAIVNANVPNMVAQISAKLAAANLNIIDLLNKSRDEIAYTLIDIDGQLSDTLLNEINRIDNVIQVRCLQNSAAICEVSTQSA
jgi:D-3-phosphoglycerate dehydrogenase / 2-oxoglutarate reductase